MGAHHRISRPQVILLHRFLNDADLAPPGLEAAFTAALHAAAASHHAAVERALDWVIAMCVRARALLFAPAACFGKAALLLHVLRSAD